MTFATHMMVSALVGAGVFVWFVFFAGEVSYGRMFGGGVLSIIAAGVTAFVYNIFFD